MKLGEIIDLNALQEIQDCFAKATGFGAITADYQGKPLLEYSCFSPFCQKLRKDRYCNALCRQSDAHGSLEAARRNSVCIYRCYAGLVDFAIPIIVDGEYIASMLCGQVLVENSEDVTLELMPPINNPFLDDPELAQLYTQIPVLPFNRIEETAKLMHLTLNYIVEQYLLNKKNVKLLLEHQERIELEKQYKDLEVKFYHSQINPHFLFNALNVAGRQAYIEGAEKTQEIIYALADMYRHSLNNIDMFITVEKELLNLKNYMFVQQVRFGEQLQIHIDIPDSMRQYILPAMSLQTLVENAVRHGLEPKEDLGTVLIRGHMENGRLNFEVSDTGRGITDAYLQILNDKDYIKNLPPKMMGTGIYNMKKRLQYFFPENFSLRFSSKPGQGTTVLLELPAKKQPLMERNR